MAKTLVTAFTLGIVTGTVLGGQLAEHKRTENPTVDPQKLDRRLESEEQRFLELWRKDMKMRRKSVFGSVLSMKSRSDRFEI